MSGCFYIIHFNAAKESVNGSKVSTVFEPTFPYHRPENTAIMIKVTMHTMPIIPEHFSSHRDFVQLPIPPVKVVNMAKLNVEYF